VADASLGSDLFRGQCCCLSAQLFQFGAQLAQLGDLSIHLGDLGLDLSQDVGTRSLTPLPQRQDLADFLQREVQSLRAQNERQPLDVSVGVHPVAAGIAGGPGHQADFLVVANRLGIDPQTPSQFADQHVSFRHRTLLSSEAW